MPLSAAKLVSIIFDIELQMHIRSFMAREEKFL